MKKYHHISILGGHALALSYYQKILAAQKAGLIDFVKCQMIDPNSECLAAQSQAPAFISKKYSDFILEYIENKDLQNPGDTLIPDHTAPHVMLQVYLDLVKKYFPKFKTQLSAFVSDFQTPFLHKSADEAIWALSYATWSCPSDCDEPAICPHTKNNRTWDFDVSLKNILEKIQREEEIKKTKISVNRFACEILVYEIAQISFSKITEQVNKFLNEMKINPPEKKPQKIIVATHSHCHGILGQFSISV